MKLDYQNGCTAATYERVKRFVDFTSGGIFAAGLGLNSPYVIGALREVSGQYCSYAPRFGNYHRDKYLEELKEFTGFESAALFSAGTEATEAFWRLCRTINGKPGVWGGLVDPEEIGKDKPHCDQFHGMTLGALIMAGRMTWQELGYFPQLGESRFGLSPESTSCMIMEPYHAPSGQFHRLDPTIKRIQTMQQTFPEIFLCLDEIQGGFGRTGKLWAHQHYVDGGGYPLLKPQFVTIGKIAGGGLPLSALLGPKDLMEGEDAKKAHLHSTHSGNPLMCAVGSAVIKAMRDFNLIGESERKGKILHGELAKLPVPSHGAGLMAGLEFLDEREASRVVSLCEDRGLLVVDTGRRWVKIGPALVIGNGLLLEGIGILREVVEEVYAARGDNCAADGSGSEVVPPPGVPGTGDQAGDMAGAGDRDHEA